MTAWTHRIDKVPRPGSRIVWKRGEEPERRGWVAICKPCDTFYAGIGDDRRLIPDDGDLLLIPSKTYDFWRYE